MCRYWKKIAKWEIISSDKNFMLISKIYENSTLEFSKNLKSKKYFSNEVKYSSDLEGDVYQQNTQKEVVTFKLLSKKITNKIDFEEFISSVLQSNSIQITSNLYRIKPIYLTNNIESRYEAINANMIESKIEDLIEKISNSDTIFDIIFIHFIFEYIHPLSDGNGRVGRMLLLNILISKKFYQKVFYSFYQK